MSTASGGSLLLSALETASAARTHCEDLALDRTLAESLIVCATCWYRLSAVGSRLPASSSAHHGRTQNIINISSDLEKAIQCLERVLPSCHASEDQKLIGEASLGLARCRILLLPPAGRLQPEATEEICHLLKTAEQCFLRQELTMEVLDTRALLALLWDAKGGAQMERDNVAREWQVLVES